MASPLAPVVNSSTGAISVGAAPGNTTVQPGYTVPNTGQVTTVGNTSYNQFGDPVGSAPTAPAAPDPYLEAIKAATAAANAANYAATPPPIDTKTIDAQARAAAENSVNPYYIKELNNFVAGQAAAKAQQQQSTDRQIADFQESLKNTQDANTVTGERTTLATADKEANINQIADWRQTDQGGKYDLDRIAAAVQTAKAGTTGSGLAAKAAGTAENTFDTTESRQATADNQAKYQAELGKAQTFEDLANSNTLAKASSDKGVTRSNEDLVNFFTNQNNALVDYQNKQEHQRQSDIAATKKVAAQDLVNKFIQSIANPQQQVAAYKAYGGLYG